MQYVFVCKAVNYLSISTILYLNASGLQSRHSTVMHLSMADSGVLSRYHQWQIKKEPPIFIDSSCNIFLLRFSLATEIIKGYLLFWYAPIISHFDDTLIHNWRSTEVKLYIFWCRMLA